MPVKVSHIKKCRGGQTMIEAMVALGALTVGFLGISALLVRSFSLNRADSNELTASYLAAEGIEIAKNVIYYEGVSRDNWNDPCFASGQKYEVDFSTMISSSCPSPSSGSDLLYFDHALDLYGYEADFPGNDLNTSTQTIFSRYITITGDPALKDSNGNYEEWTVTSYVSWPDGNVQLEDHLYHWYYSSP